MSVSSQQTYPISVGPKGSDHSCVEKKFHCELKELRSGSFVRMYNGQSKSMVNVHVELFASLNDQLERRSLLCLSHGNSRFHARWGYSIDFKSVLPYIAACSDCQGSLLSDLSSSTGRAVSSTAHTWRSGSCTKCTCWLSTISHPLLSYVPEKQLPEDKKQGPNGTITPFRLDFSTLKKAFHETHMNVSNGIWSSKEGAEFLRVHCISRQSSQELLLRASNCKMLADATSDPDGNGDLLTALLEDERENPLMYKELTPPPSWSEEMQIALYPDVPMHLAFLGTTKVTVLDVQSWTSCRGKSSMFKDYVSGILESVACLRLPWCQVLPYSSGTFVGWISENYVGLARLLRWFYAPISNIAKDPPYIPPITPQAKWRRMRMLCGYVSVAWTQLVWRQRYDLACRSRWQKEHLPSYLRKAGQATMFSIWLVFFPI